MSRLDAYKPDLKKAGKMFQNAAGTVIASPTLVSQRIKRMRSDADAKIINNARGIPKNIHPFGIGNEVTDAYKARSLAEDAKKRVIKRASKLK